MKTIHYLVSSIVLLVLMTNCTIKKDNLEPEFKLNPVDTINENEYQIYSLILKEKFVGSKELIIKQSTSISISSSFVNSYYESLKTELPNLDETIFIDFVVKNDSSYHLDNKFIVPAKTVSLITNEETQYLFQAKDINQGWFDFYHKYPDSIGMIDFTRVGLNSAKNQAIVSMGHYYASLGADGVIIYLVKENSSWRIIKTINTWVS